MPASMRMVEPEFPQSKGAEGPRNAPPANLNGTVGGLCDLAAQCTQTFEGAGAIGAGRKVLQSRGSLRESREHGVAMGDGFIAGQ